MQPFAYLLDAVLPPRCPACGAVVEEVEKFCLDCWSQLDFLVGEGCASCNRPMEAAGLTCANCLLQPPTHGLVHAAVAYGEVARRRCSSSNTGGDRQSRAHSRV